MGAEQPRTYRFDEQEHIPFYGHEIIAVRLDDGQIVVTLQSLCEGMNLVTSAQIRRAERTEALAGEVARPWLETDYGAQERPALTLAVLPGWLMGVDTKRLKGEAHDTVLAYQREAYGVLYQHFTTRALALPAPQTAIAIDPQIAPAVAALTEQIADMAGVMRLMQEHLQALLGVPEQIAETRALVESLAERQDSTDARLAAVDVRTKRLTPAHARAAQTMIDRMVRETAHGATPLTHQIIYGKLKTRFQVASYKEVDDARFEELMAWLQDALSNATGGQAPAQGSLF